MPLPFSNLVSDLASGGPNILSTTLASFGLIKPQWGVYSAAGSVVVTADSVKSFEHRKDYSISNYPQEQGAFQSYNKVTQPFLIRVSFTSGGNLANRQALINSIAAIEGRTNLYSVVTPEKTYLNCNVSHTDMARKADSGVGLITVNVWFTQIRVTVPETTASTTKTPQAAAPTNTGTVQTTAPSASQQSAVTSAPGGPLSGGGV